jgi:hypothetical protein
MKVARGSEKRKTLKNYPTRVKPELFAKCNQNICIFFLQAQTLKMNTTFDAVKVDADPVRIMDKKTMSIRMNVTLTDEVKRYWGFYLLQGSKVNISTCAR